MDTQPKIGRVTIAPEVLETIARLTTLAIPGVVRLTTPPGIRRLLRHDGVKIEVVENVVRVQVYVIAGSDTNLLALGRQIQHEVARAIQDLVGMDVESVDVHIEDVAYPTSA